MALFVFITDNCREEASEHPNWSDRLESFAKELEKKQTVAMFEHFPPPYLVKKKFGEYSGRLIAAHVMVGEERDDSVVVLLSALVRGDGKYEAFSNDAVAYGQQHLEQLYRGEDWAAYVWKRKEKEPPKPKPDVSEDEYGYLHGALSAVSARVDEGETPAEELVAESSEWVKRCGETTFQNWHSHLHKAVEQAVFEETGHDLPGGRMVRVPGCLGWSVLLRSFPQHRLLWLAAPVVDNDQAALKTLRKMYAPVLTQETPSLETVLKASRRAYPAVLLLAPDMWMNLQREVQANMALSPEESQVLRSARRQQGADGTVTGGFPMFINGRAGSGKTTILQYLFAEILFYHLTKGEAAAPPIYFTCNRELLRNSREFVEKLLSCNASYSHHDGDRGALVKESKAVLDGAFKEFHEHLLSLVEPTERTERFAKDKYVGYARFKQLWTARFGKLPKARKEFGPDVSWHVIRSYIKGLTSEELTDFEEYQRLDKKQVTVTHETYKAVYQNVWTNWYQPVSQTDGYWDDQDLARYLIEADDARRRAEEEPAGIAPAQSAICGLRAVHPAIFCDESQDFTRIELEVILRMSLFSERSLKREDVAMVPFVFAGDQFQTLNPTGFRWEAIKAFFVEKFIFALATHRPKTIDLNYQELTYNYRSSRSIVRFSNYVQALRARLFDLTSLQPQQPWEDEHNPPPVTYFLGDNDEFWTRLKKEADVAIIVPCGEGEELDYIKQDPVLSKKVQIVDNAPNRIVLSAVGAKGLEFTRVVVYGFGDMADRTLLEPLFDCSKSYADDPDRSLPLQYFINRLYVAVSRAKRRLFIVDSADGFKKLWDFAHDEKLEKAIVEGIRNGRETWGKAIARLESGRTDDLSRDRAADPLENAETLARDGRARGNALHLLQAANIYRNNGHEQDAIRCKADAARIEGKFIEAAGHFLGCKAPQQATECFWRAERPGWAALCKAAERHPELIGRLEYGFARAIGGKPTVTETTTLFKRLDELLADEQGREESVGNPSWAVAVRALLDAIRELAAPKGEWLSVFDLVEKIVAAGIRVGTPPRAQLAYRAGELEQAVKLWDAAGERGSHEYKIARAFSAPYPEKLAALHEIVKREEIIAEYERHTGVALSPDQSRFVGRAYLHQQNYDLALPLLVEAKDTAGIGELIAGAQPRQPNLALKASIAQFAVVAAADDWLNALPYVQGRSLPCVGRTNSELGAWMTRHKENLDLALMRAMSRADSIVKLTWDAKREKVTQRPFAEYLQRTFFVKNSSAIADEYVVELGAAIERSGSRMGALRFYETIRDDGATSVERKQHALERWVVCKERQAQFLAQDGDAKAAGLQSAEAKKEREKLGMKPGDKLDEFPKLDPLAVYLASVMRASANTTTPPADKAEVPETPYKPEVAPVVAPTAKARKVLDKGILPPKATVTPAEPAKDETRLKTAPPAAIQKWNIGGLDFEFYRDAGRLNINGENGLRVSVRLAKGSCSSEDLTVTPDDEKPKKFKVEEWNLIVDLDNAHAVLIELPGEKLQLRVMLGEA